MSNKLAARQKTSLTVKSPVDGSLPSKKTPSHKRRYDSEKNFEVMIFPFAVCLIFSVHWIIVCRLIWALLFRTEFSADWPNFWPYLYWLVAFVVWLTWMVVLIVIWRRRVRRSGLTSEMVFGRPPLKSPRNDDCCLLPNEIMIPQFHQGNSITALATPVIFYQSLPLQLEYGLEPEQVLFAPELNPIEGCMHSGQIVDNIRHLYLGKQPLVVKQCTRCGGKAQVQNMTRTAAIRAWDQRWTSACRCSGTWRIHKAS